jgi:hypothetical protein
MKLPKSKLGQIGLAILGGVLLTPPIVYASFRFSLAYFAWKYPYAGQDGLGAIAIALAVLIIEPIAASNAVFCLQQLWTNKDSRNTSQ